MSEIIPVTYYTGIPNIGDLANADLVECMSEGDVYQTRDVDRPHLLGIGSTMEWAQPASLIWGTGIMDPTNSIDGVRSKNIYALRGRHTRDLLHKSGLSVDVPLGDPAFLLPKILRQATSSKTQRLGVVPHYVDRLHPFFVQLLTDLDTVYLDVMTIDVKRFIYDLSRCEAIISSSLHGIIFAESLGIPNLWVKVGDKIGGGTFKFEDWFSTTRHPQTEPFCPNSAMAASELYTMCRLHETLIDEHTLIDSFPQTLLIAAGAPYKEIANLRNVTKCRAAGMHLFIDLSAPFNHQQLFVTIGSAIEKWSHLLVILVGRYAAEFTAGREFESLCEKYPDAQGVTNLFMKRFWSSWAEPQQHIIAEAGFNFAGIDITRDVQSELVSRAECDAIVVDRGGLRSIHRRAGRWY